MKELSNKLAVSFTCASGMALDSIVEISDTETVAVPTSEGSADIIGRVVNVNDTTCTVMTRHSYLSDDYTSASGVAVGAFVLDENGKPMSYSSASHDSAAIQGHCTTAAGAGEKPTLLIY